MTRQALTRRDATHRSSRGGSLPAVVMAGFVALLQGCGAPDLLQSDREALRLNTPAERHAISFRSGRAVLDVEVPPSAKGLSRNQEADVLEFLDRYAVESTGGPLRISVPSSAGDQGRGGAALRNVRALADEAGVPAASIRVERHTTRSAAGGALKLSYSRREVVPPECGDWSEDLGINHDRIHYPNFGCATQRNLALNVANPRDLQRPAREQPGSSERRSANWTKYVGAAGAPADKAADAVREPIKSLGAAR